MFPPLSVKTAAAKAIPASMEELAKRPVTSLSNVPLVNVVRTLMGSSVKLVRNSFNIKFIIPFSCLQFPTINLN